jgi:hypothetical protein
VGFDTQLVAISLGITLAATLFCLFGIALVVRYESINEFLMPSVVYTSLLSLPLLGIWGSGPESSTWRIRSKDHSS